MISPDGSRSPRPGENSETKWDSIIRNYNSCDTVYNWFNFLKKSVNYVMVNNEQVFYLRLKLLVTF